MVKSILFALLLIFAVIGICEIIYIIKMMIYYPGIRIKNYSVIVLKSKYSIKQLNYIWQKINWYGDSYALGVIAITDALDNNEVSMCTRFARGKNIALCHADSLRECEFLQGEI